MPGPDVLKAIRQEIFYNFKTFDGILQHKHFASYYNGLSDFGKTSRPPKGYDASFEGIELLKNKSFVVGNSVTDSLATSPEFFDYLVDAFRAMQPFCAFLNGPVDDLKPA